MNIIDRLKERSTWQGLITVAALAGLHFSPENAEIIIEAGIALVAAILIFTKDKK